jgi:hypothetical protein
MARCNALLAKGLVYLALDPPVSPPGSARTTGLGRASIEALKRPRKQGAALDATLAVQSRTDGRPGEIK